MPPRIAPLTPPLCAAIPPLAPAAPPPPFRDSTSKIQATAAQSSGNTSVRIALTDGGSIKVSFTAAVGTQQQLAQDYVAFLESLPHGPELRQLKVLIDTPDAVATDCGDDGT